MLHVQKKFKFIQFILFTTCFKIYTVFACYPGLLPLSNYDTDPFNNYNNFGLRPDISYVAAAGTKSRMASHDSLDNNVRKSYSLDNSLQETSCRKRYPNKQLICGYPYKKISLNTEIECENFCTENYFSQCRSFQFDSVNLFCSLFKIVPHVQNNDDYDLMSNPNTDFNNYNKRFRRFFSSPSFLMNKELTTNFQSSSENFKIYEKDSCTPSLVPNFNQTFVIIDFQCYKNQNSVQLPQTFSQSNSKTISQQGLQSFKSNLDELDCGDETISKMQIIEGITIKNYQPMTEILLENSDECSKACKTNTHNGNLFTKICRAAIFDRSNSVCKILAEVITPNGNLPFQSDLNSIYYEKFCLPQLEFLKNCDKPINRIPQYSLNIRESETIDVISAKSQSACINACLTSFSKYGVHCSSINHFFDWTTRNCYLNQFTRETRPEFFDSERYKSVDYLEFTDCMRNEQKYNFENSKKYIKYKSNDYEWSEWSKCDLETRTKTRFHKCLNEKDCTPFKETIDCLTNQAYNKNIALDDKNYNKFTYYSESRLNKNHAKQIFDNEKKCDPHKKCCKKENELKKLIQGCSIGYRILENGTHKSCMPENCL